MAKLDSEWYHAFDGNFDTEEDVIEFMFERFDTKDFQDSYRCMGGAREPNEMFKVTANEKRQLFYDFMMKMVSKNMIQMGRLNSL